MKLIQGTDMNLRFSALAREASPFSDRGFRGLHGCGLLRIEEGQTAGFGNHMSTYQGKPFWDRFFEPQPHSAYVPSYVGTPRFVLRILRIVQRLLHTNKGATVPFQGSNCWLQVKTPKSVYVHMCNMFFDDLVRATPQVASSRG